MRAVLVAALLALIVLMPAPTAAQTDPAHPDPAQLDVGPSVLQILQDNRDKIEKPSRQTIGPVIAALAQSGDPQAATVLFAWANRGLGLRKADGRFFLVSETADGYALRNLDETDAGTATRAEITELRPNSGVRGVIASSLVQFQLADPNTARRAEALTSIARDPSAEALAPLRASIQDESDPVLLARKMRLERLLTLRFDDDPAERVAAIEGFSGDLGLDLRGALNPLLATTRRVAPLSGTIEGNLARELTPGRDLPETEAYDILVSEGLAPARLSPADLKAALVANIVDGTVAGIPVVDLDDQPTRNRAYTALETAGAVPLAATDEEVTQAVAQHRFALVYSEPDATVTAAATAVLSGIELKLAAMQTADLALDALSLGSIYFLAAIGLAITFGVMRVINMAHGEFIMMGAYTGYVVQLFIPNYTLSLVVALPLAFLVTFAAGVAMERLVIRHLYKRPLETLLATFGISIALQQLAKTIFGTQARPLTSPAWLDGALTFNDVVSISYIRIAIFVLAILFLLFFLWLMKRTRLGLEVRAVTQNPSMAASMGINPDRINMLTFGLGSGIAGIAGIAIGLFAKVTSELGNDYIVQSFMTVVVGGVGNIWGTLAGALMIGTLQKGIEWLNPSNTLAAQTYMILFIILFIQFRPRGIIALKGRAAGD
jgi:urea transport system permease protein